MGRLNFASQFVPDYKRIVAPVMSLLGNKGGGKWRPEHTECLNLLANIIHSRVKLGLCDMSKTVKLHVDEDGVNGSVVLT
jgi:hypothetical protein